MTDDQLRMQIEMLKNNKEMARMAFSQQHGGAPIDDAQLDMMLSMMTPEMMRMSAKMAKENPDLLKQRTQGAAASPQQTQGAQT